MSDVSTSDSSLEPSTALAEQRQTAIEKAGALTDFADIAKVNATFKREDWSIEKKIKLLVKLAKNVTKKPGIAMAAMKMLDTTWTDAIARSALQPKASKVPPPGPSSTAEQLGMPSLGDLESIQEVTRTVTANFKENVDGKNQEAIHTAPEARSDTIDIPGTPGSGSRLDAPAGSGDVEPSDRGTNINGSADSGKPNPGSDPDSEAYFQDDRDAGEIHRPPTDGSYGVRQGSI